MTVSAEATPRGEKQPLPTDPDAPMTVPELLTEVVRLKAWSKDLAAPSRVIDERIAFAIDGIAEGRLYSATGMVRSAREVATVLVNAACPERAILSDLLDALAPIIDLWACDHRPRLGVDVDPECPRCESMGTLRRTFAWAMRETKPAPPSAREAER